VPVVRAISLNAGRSAEIFHYLITTRHRAAERSTNADVRFAGAFLAQHRIKRDQLENVNRLQLELLRDPRHRVIADESKMFLPKVKQRQRGTSLVGARVTRDRRVHISL
jgi:hypothetical protein